MNFRLQYLLLDELLYMARNETMRRIYTEAKQRTIKKALAQEGR